MVMKNRFAVCRLCDHAHSMREPHVLIGGPEPSKDVKRLARPAVSKTIRSRAQAVTLERATAPEPADLAAAYDGIGPLSPENARLLTDRLKVQVEALGKQVESIGRVLELAQRREAWRALGYASWDAYVEAEFEMARRYANRLVSHERFVLALALPPASVRDPVTSEVDTSGATGPTLTEGQTRAVRNDPDKVARVQRAVAQGVPPAEAVRRAALPAKATERTRDPATGAACQHEPVTVVVCKNCGKRLE